MAKVLPVRLFLNVTERTSSACPVSVAVHLPVATSHNLIVLSLLPDAKLLLSGLKTMEVMGSVWPFRAATFLTLATSAQVGSPRLLAVSPTVLLLLGPHLAPPVSNARPSRPASCRPDSDARSVNIIEIGLEIGGTLSRGHVPEADRAFLCGHRFGIPAEPHTPKRLRFLEALLYILASGHVPEL